MSDYWKDVVSEALDDAGVSATPEQIETLVKHVASGHECYGQAHGHHCIPSPIELEAERLRAELKHERALVHCRECNGRGSITDNFGVRQSVSQCWKCSGRGKVKP